MCNQWKKKYERLKKNNQKMTCDDIKSSVKYKVQIIKKMYFTHIISETQYKIEIKKCMLHIIISETQYKIEIKNVCYAYHIRNGNFWTGVRKQKHEIFLKKCFTHIYDITS